MKKTFILPVLILFLIPAVIHPIVLTHLKTFYNAWAPKAVEVSPDGKYAAVMNLEGRNFWLIDTSTLETTVSGTFPGTFAQGWDYDKKEPIDSLAEKPVECAFSDGGRYCWMSFHNGSCVVVFDTTGEQTLVDDTNLQFTRKQTVYTTFKETGKVETQSIPLIETGETPKVIAVTPDEKYVIVANWHDYSVSIIDTATFTEIERIKVGTIPRGLAVTSDSKTCYVARMGGGGIAVIDLETFEYTETIWPGSYRNPRHIVLGSGDRYLYISDNRSGTVIKYDLAAREITDTVYVGAQARSIAISPNERYIFAVSHEGEEIVTIDNDTFEIVDRFDYEKPMGISVSPDGTQLWVTSYQGGYVSVYGIDYEVE